MSPSSPLQISSMQSSDAPVPIDDRFLLSRLDDDFIKYYNDNLALLGANPPLWVRDTSTETFVNDIGIPSDDGHVFTVRCYQPDRTTSPYGAGPYPVHINFHGGGFVLGDLCSDAHLCLGCRDRLGIMVVDVDYRLAPAHTFGHGHDDAWAAVRWIHAHAAEMNALVDSISIGGISAGGHISAVCQQLARDAGIRLKLAILSVPGTWRTDTSDVAKSLTPSLVENEFAPCLNWERMKWFARQYTAQTEQGRAEVWNRPAFFRLPVHGNLVGLCETFLATADCDPCRSEGEALGLALVAQGVKVTMRRYMGVPHPFMHMQPIRKAQLYVDDVCEALRNAHRGQNWR